MKQTLKTVLGPRGSERLFSTAQAVAGLAKAIVNAPFVDIAYLGETVRKMRGVAPRSCLMCGYRGHFLAFGSPPRWDARCPKCNSLERHRLLYLALENGFALPHNCEVLHFAPEPAVTKFIKPKATKYVTADISGAGVDLALDITKLAVPDASYDVIVCNHVLEHVDDHLALSEMYRALRPGGRLYAMTPVCEGWDKTYENPSVDGAHLREVHFGQCDHVRFYGSDIRERIAAAGFVLEEFTAEGSIVIDHGLWRGEKVFICTKPPRAT